MRKHLKEIKISLLIFIFWRIGLFTISILAQKILPYKNSFPYVNYVLEPTKLPEWIYSFGNFDGVHYLRIAQNGYQDAYYQAFFPLYPLFIKFFNIFPKSGLDLRVFVDPSYFTTGFLLSNLFLLVSIYLLVILAKSCKEIKNPILVILLVLSFPTAYYFGAVYTESLFLMELIAFVLLLKKDKYLVAGIIAAMASATRLIGILFFPILLWEIVRNRKGIKRHFLSLLVSPLGFLAFMAFQIKKYGSPFAFIISQSGFGAQRSSLPFVTPFQVIYRYLKIITSVTDKFLIFTSVTELLFTVFIVFMLVMSFKKIRMDYWSFAFLAALIPTLTGTLSSMPRYIIFSYLVCIPVILKWPSKYQKLIIGIFVLIQIVFVTFFTRGYWIS